MSSLTPLTLYGMPGDASQVAHILLREANLSFEVVDVNPHTQRTERGDDYRTINASGRIPALELAPGAVITDLLTILRYIADRVPDRKLLPTPTDSERSSAATMLAFLALAHRTFLTLFDAESVPTKALPLEQLCRQIDLLDRRLSERPFLMGRYFTAPDAYLFVLAAWLPFIGLQLERWPSLAEFRRRTLTRPSVRATLVAEGFLFA